MEAIFRSVGFHLGALLGGMKVLKADLCFCLKKKRNPESVSLPSSSCNNHTWLSSPASNSQGVSQLQRGLIYLSPLSLSVLSAQGSSGQTTLPRLRLRLNLHLIFRGSLPRLLLSFPLCRLCRAGTPKSLTSTPDQQHFNSQHNKTDKEFGGVRYLSSASMNRISEDIKSELITSLPPKPRTGKRWG